MDEYTVWFGSATSYTKLTDLRDFAFGTGNVKLFEMDQEDEVIPEPDLFQRIGPLAVVSVVGPLASESSPLDKWLGITSYPWLREALQEAVEDSAIKAILLNMDTPGGDGSGLSEVANQIRRINRDFKPIYAYSGGSLASAGYWLASQASKIMVSDSAEVGSVGVLAIHREVTERLKQQGIAVKVFRSGAYKALGNPFEELMDAAKESIQTRIDYHHQLFVSAIAEGRHISLAQATELADGKVWIGRQALSKGLVDSVDFLDNTIASLLTGLQTSHITNSLGIAMNRNVVITPAIQAALESGASLEQAAPLAQDENSEITSTVEGDSDPAGAEVITAATETPTPTTEVPGLVQFLQTQAVEKDAKIVELTVKLLEVQQKLSALESSHAPLCQIARDTIARMAIPLGGAPVGLEVMEDRALIAQYSVTQEKFVTRFPIGGVVQLSISDEEEVSDDDSSRKGALRAVKFK